MKKQYLLILSIIFFLASACSSATAEPQSAEPVELEKIDLGVGFVPNVQFTPFYVAQAKGFYADEGLDVALEHGFENDFVALTAQGQRQFAIASGDQVILARSQGLPVVYIMKWYEGYPVGLAALADSGIDSPDDLVGASVGIPGLFGATYVAWKALAYANKLNESEVDLQEINFTQAEALDRGQVDAALVYIANEPIQLESVGKAVNLVQVSDYINLVSNGLISNESLIKENPELAGRMVRASLRGLQYTLEHPDEAFEIARTFIPDMTDEDVPTQRRVLEESIKLWHSDTPGLSSEQAWQDSANFMLESGLIEQAVMTEDLYSNQFVETQE